MIKNIKPTTLKEAIVKDLYNGFAEITDIKQKEDGSIELIVNVSIDGEARDLADYVCEVCEKYLEEIGITPTIEFREKFGAQLFDRIKKTLMRMKNYKMEN